MVYAQFFVNHFLKMHASQPLSFSLFCTMPPPPPPFVSLTWQPHSPLSFSHGNPLGLHLSRTNPPSRLFRTDPLSQFGDQLGTGAVKQIWDPLGLAEVTTDVVLRLWRWASPIRSDLSLSLSRFVG